MSCRSSSSVFSSLAPVTLLPRPGDPGWVARARVPRPSGNDYVRRPEWQTDADLSKIKKQEKTKMDRHMIAAANRKRNALANRRAVDMSLEGRKMAL